MRATVKSGLAVNGAGRLNEIPPDDVPFRQTPA